MTDTIGSIPPPGTPFSAPPAPEPDTIDPEVLAAAIAGEPPPAPAPAPEPEPVAEHEHPAPERPSRDPERDLTLALRGIEEIDVRLVALQAQVALGVGALLICAAALLVVLKVRAEA